MEEIRMKQNVSNKEINVVINTTTRAKPNRHVSVLYGMQYLTRVPVVKRCRKTEYECFANINKKEIFGLLHKFAEKLLTSNEYLTKVLEDMKFIDNQIDATIVQNKPLIKCNILCEKGELSNSSIDPQERMEDKTQKNIGLTLKVPNKQKSYKKISIMMDGCFNDFDDQSSGSALFSDQSITPGVSSINICQQQFTQKMVETIYQQPQPFLINLSVCLMLKFLYFSETKLTAKNVCWILSIGTIVAYKIYYDEPVEGLIDSFAYILKVKREDIISLQRFFLGAINHEAVISNQQYHSVLYQIIRQGQSGN